MADKRRVVSITSPSMVFVRIDESTWHGRKRRSWNDVAENVLAEHSGLWKRFADLDKYIAVASVYAGSLL